MVFPGSNEEQSMAMGPERSKPLHNFMLPCLKWGSQRHLRCMKVSPDDGDRRSPTATRKREFDPPPNNARDSDKRLRVTKPRIHGDDGIDAVREKLMLDLKTEADRMKDAILRKEVAEENDGGDEEAPPPVVEGEQRAEASAAAAAVAGAMPWTLRTRRAVGKSPVAGDSGKALRIEEKKPHSSPLRINGVVASKSPKPSGSPEKVEKVEFSVSLSKKEIEEDFMKLVGHRPPRRPKRRPKHVQKQLDSVFPGLWLSEINADSYKVPDDEENGKS